VLPAPKLAGLNRSTPHSGIFKRELVAANFQTNHSAVPRIENLNFIVGNGGWAGTPSPPGLLGSSSRGKNLNNLWGSIT